MKVKRLSSAVLAAAIGATATQGMAAVLEETIVTAQKREQSMQDVPFSVSALSGTRLEQSGVVDLLDLQNVSPSLMMPSSGNPGQGASFRLRGFGSPPFQLGIEPAVATFVDGIYRSRSGVANRLYRLNVGMTVSPGGPWRTVPDGAVKAGSDMSWVIGR